MGFLILLVLILLYVGAFGVSKGNAGLRTEETAVTTAPSSTPASTGLPTPEPTPVPTEMPPNYLRKVFADPSAEYLDMGDVIIQDFDAFFAFLDRLPNLKNVDMFATRIRAGKIEELAMRYPNIHFGMTMQIAEHLVRTDQTAFSTLHYKTSAPHKSSDFSVLKYCDHLQALDIGHNAVDDLGFLYDLPELKVLIIAINHITDITPLASLPDLEYAEIFKNRITDLTPLSGLTHLIDLNICFNYIEDYSPILKLTQLERLWLFNSNNYSFSRPVPDETVQQLIHALPNAEIDSTHYSTAGTWRTHPRYEIIKKMFKTGTYIPFSE